MQTAIISVSPRKGSASLNVAKYIQSLAQAKGGDAPLFSFEGISFPSVADGYIQPADLQGKQKELYDLVVASQRVVWVVPEYNRMMPSEYVAMIHQFLTKSFMPFWENKVFGFVGVSSGVGGREPIYTSDKVFNYAINSMSVAGSHVSPFHFQSTFTGDQFDTSGAFIGNEKYAASIQKFVDSFWV